MLLVFVCLLFFFFGNMYVHPIFAAISIDNQATNIFFYLEHVEGIPLLLHLYYLL